MKVGRKKEYNWFCMALSSLQFIQLAFYIYEVVYEEIRKMLINAWTSFFTSQIGKILNIDKIYFCKNEEK